MVLIKVGEICSSKLYCVDRLREILKVFNLNADVPRSELEENLKEFAKGEMKKAGVKDINVRLINKYELDIPENLAVPKISVSVSSENDADPLQTEDDILINFDNPINNQQTSGSQED